MCILVVDSCNNICEHLCKAHNGKCACRSGYILASDGSSCLKCASVMDGIISPTWNVAICNKRNFSLPLVCSGSLLNDQWVLTSASCVCNAKNNNDLVVRSGKVHTCSVSESKETEHSIRDIYCYSDFRSTNLDFDLALIKLNTTHVTKVELHNIRPVCIQRGRVREQVRPNDQVIYFGWGSIASATPDHSILKKSISTVLHKRKCKSSFLKENTERIFFCTMTNTSDTCAGSLGSGVASISVGNNKRLLLQGVISKSTNECGQPGSFIANSEVQSKKIQKWIQKVFKL